MLRQAGLCRLHVVCSNVNGQYACGSLIWPYAEAPLAAAFYTSAPYAASHSASQVCVPRQLAVTSELFCLQASVRLFLKTSFIPSSWQAEVIVISPQTFSVTLHGA